MRERADIERNRSKTPIVVLLVLFFAVVCLRPAETDYGFVYMIIAIFLLTASAYLIIYRYLAYYSYQITSNELLIIKNIGSHEKYMMIAPFDKINFIEPYDGQLTDINYPVGDAYAGEFYDGGRVRRFTFSPSEKLLKKLKAELGDRLELI